MIFDGVSLLPEIDGVDSLDMPPKDLEPRVQATEEKINRSNDKLNEIAQRLAKIEGHLEAKKTPNPILVPLIALGSSALIAWWGWMSLQLIDHGNKLAQIYPFVIQQGLKAAAQDPQNPHNTAEVENLINTAKKQKIAIPHEVLRDVGLKFISASDANPAAWDVATRLISYDTLARQIEASNSRTNVNFTRTNGECMELRAPNNTVHNVNLLGRCTQVLDRTVWSNVVFDGLHIVYQGGPVTLSRVWFVNCTFEMPPKPDSKRLAEGLLASGPIDVTLPGS